MNELFSAVLAGFAGLLIGAVFFGGLWWTIGKGVSSQRPALWFLGSLLLRTGIALAGFYFIGRGNWARMLSCVIGFIAARLVVTRLTRPPTETSMNPEGEGGHAS